MSAQTVVDVIVSGSTATVVDKRVDGVTTVAGAAPVTNVSGQVPDLGVNTDILATQGDILSLTNDVASLRANLIITGTNLTDEIGLLSGTLISTGNQLNFTINTLSGELIATGNSLDSFRNVLSGNLISTGIRLQDQLNVNTDLIADLRQATGDLNRDKLDKAGGTISGNILPSASGTISLGSAELPFLSGHFKDLTVSNNTLFIGDVPIHSANGGIDFLSATGETFFKDVTIRNLTVTGTETIIDVDHLAVKDNTITLNSGEEGAGISLVTGGIIIDRGTLPDADILFNEENDRFELNFPVAVQGSPVITKGETGSFAVKGQLDATGINLQNQIISNDTDISNTISNLSTTGSTLSNKILTFSGQVDLDFLATGSSIDSLSGNLIATGNTLESSINSITSNVNTTGQTLQAQITTNAGSITSLDSAVKATGLLLQNQITDNDSEINTLTSNLSSTGQALQVQIIENDNDLSNISGKLGETGLFLSNEIAIVSGVAGGDRFNQLSGNLITTGQYLTSEIAIVSGMTTGGAAVDVLSGHLVSTGQYLTSEVSTVSGLITNNDNEISALLAATGELKTDIAGNATNMGATGQFLQNQINGNDNDIANLNTRLISTGNHLVDVTNLNTSDIRVVSGLVVSNDGDISNLQSATGELKNLSDSNSVNLISTGDFLTSEIGIVSGIAGGQDLTALSGNVNVLSGNVIVTGQTLQTQILSNDSEISSITSNLITTGQYLTEEIAIVSGLTTGSSSDPALSGKVDTLSGNLITTGQTLTTNINTVSSSLIATGKTLTDNVNTVSSNLVSTGSRVDDISGNLITTGQTLQTQITSNDSDISTLTSNLGVTGQTLQTQITSNDSDISTITSNLATTGQTLQTQITSNDSDISTLTSNLVTTGQTLTSEIAIVSGIAENASDEALSGKVDTLSGNLITTGQTLQTQITSNDSDITSLTSNLVSTGQTLTTDITTVSGLIVDNDGDITALKTATGVLKTSTDSNAANLITTGQTLQTQITSNDGDISTLTTNLGTTGQTLQTQITSNDSDISTLTSNLITTGQTLTTDITTVSGLITDNDSDITALKSATGVLKTSTDANTANLITTGQTLQTQITSNDGDITTLTSNLVTTGQTLQTEITSNDSDISTLTTNVGTTGQTLQTQITSNDSDITSLTSNLITTGQNLTTDINTVSGLITDNDADITALKTATGVLKTSSDNNTANLITTGQTLQTQITSNDGDITTLTSNLASTGQTLQTQITSNDGDITTLTSNLVTTGQTLTTNINTVATNLGTSGQTLQTQITSNDSDISTLTSNLATTGQTLQTQITSNDSDIASLTTNLGTTGQTLQTQITSNDSDISTLDSTTVKLTTNQSIAGNKIFTNDVTINNLTVTGTEVVVDVENLAVKDNIIEINSGESSAGISRISGGIVIDRGTATNANILYNDANDRFELNFPLAVEGEVVASASNLITTGQTLTTNINTVSTNLGTSGQTLQTQITSNDTDISTLTTNLGTTGQTLQAQITSNDSDISTLTTNLGTTGQTLQTQITSNDSDISTLTSNLVTTGQTLQTQITSNDSDISTLTTNIGTTGQTLQTQITSNDSDISTLTSNLVTTGQTLTTNINTVSTNLGTSGQTLQTQITSNDTDITNLSSNLVTTGQTLTTNINTVATNLVTTGQTLTSEIATVSGLIPATVIDGGGTANKVPLWSDANTIGDSVISQSSSKIGIGIASPSNILHVKHADPGIRLEDSSPDGLYGLLDAGGGDFIISADGGAGSANSFISFRVDGTAVGSEKMRITSAGSVGIGTNAPSRKFMIFGGSARMGIKNTTEGVVLGLLSDDAGYFHLNNGSGTNTIQLRGDTVSYFNAGSVGIGTNAPSEKLDVEGSLVVNVANSGLGEEGIFFRRGFSDSNKYNISILAYAHDGAGNFSDGISINGYDGVSFCTGASTRQERMRIVGGTGATSGFVGIGTNSPAEILEVVSDSDPTILIRPVTVDSANSGKISYRENAGGTTGVDLRYDGANNRFSIDTSDVANAFVVKRTDGKVGIGTNAPAHKFEVYGGGGGTFGAITNRQSANANTDGIATVNYDAGNSSLRLWVDASGNRKINAGGTEVISFTTTAVDIKQATTFSSGRATFSGTAGADGVVLAGGEDNNHSSRLFFDNGTAGEAVTILNVSAGMQFRTLGTPGSSSGTTRMYLNSAGNLGIGTPSPSVGLHLERASENNVLAVVGQDGYNSTLFLAAEGSGKDTYLTIGGNRNLQIDFATSTTPAATGTNKFTFSKLGRLGIGTNAPATILEASGTIRSTAFLPKIQLKRTGNAVANGDIEWLGNDDSVDWSIRANYDSGGDNFNIKEGSTSRLYIKSGKVGIGTVTPSSKLHVNSEISCGADDNNRAMFGYTPSRFYLGTRQSGTNYLNTVNVTSGKVGIGVVDPDQSLEVAGAIKSSGAYGFYAGRADTTWASFGTGVPTILLRGTADNSRAGAVQFKEYDGTDTAAIYSTDGTDGYGLVMAAYQGDMKFSTGSLQGYKMVILGGGSVGIGTASPDNFVHIKEGGLAGRPASNSNTSLTIEHHNNTGIQFFSGTQTQIRFGDASNTAAGAIIYKHDDDNFKLNFTDHLTINGSGGEKVRVKNDGNVGIGVSPTTRLHVLYPAVGQSGSAVTSITKTQATNLGVKLSFSGGANSTNNIIGGIALGNNGEEYAGLYAIDGGSSAATDLAFFVGDTNGINEAIHIDSGGTVQINSPASSGTRSLTVKLTDNTSGAAVFEQSSNEYLRINTTNGSEKIILGDNGTNPKINFNGEYDFPTADGTSGQVLTTDGSGTLSFSSAGSGTVSGSGTDNYIPRWNGTTALQNSSMVALDNGNVGIGQVDPKADLHIGGSFSDAANDLATSALAIKQSGAGPTYGIYLERSGERKGYYIGILSTANDGLTFMRNWGGTKSEVMVLTREGNVGIGTVAPAALLHVDGQAIIDALHFDSLSSHFIKNDGNLLRIAGDNGVKFQSYDGGWQTRMTIVDDGNVGIGTNAPDGRLHVYTGSAGSTTPNTNHDDLTIESSGNAGLQLFTPDANYQYVAFGSPAGANRGYVRYGHNEEEMVLRAATVDILKIKSTGVGIGTTPNSSAKLESYITSGGEKGLRLNSNFSGGNAVDFIPAVVGVSNAGFSIDLAGTTRFVINDGGNVGIGTNSAGGKLHVYGGTTAFTNLSDNTDSIQITRNSSVHTHQDAKLFIYDNSNADWAQKIELGTASYGLRIGGWTDYGVAVYQNTKGLVFSTRTNETVINDGAADYDFRVEGDTDDYLLFTEGSTDRVAISTTAPAAKLHVEGDFKVGTTNNGNWMGYKDVSLNGNTYTTALTINLNNHTGCYVKLFLSGDWSSHSAVAFVGEYFIQNGSDGYAEPGTVISEFDNTNTDSIESKIVDPSSDTFTIQLKLSTAANGTLAGKLSYHVMGMATAVS